ncbi:MAG: hypothetical protein N3B21_18185 [Clostridia bacterium]|nr:hypothetical protein [Clostridia bacterium]
MAYNCPHCDKLMYPEDDGSCPYCKEIVRKKLNLTVQETSPKKNPCEIIIKHEQLLPDICCICGENANNSYKKIKFSRSTLSKAPAIGAFITLLTFLISPLILFFRFSDNGRYEKIETRMPMCKKCKKAKNSISPEWVSFEDNEAAFIVHSKLKEEFSKTTKYFSYRK